VSGLDFPGLWLKFRNIANDLLSNRSNIAAGCRKRLYIPRAKERSPAEPGKAAIAAKIPAGPSAR
jgi:hypothetical protein